MGESSKFLFGTGIKPQVAERIQAHVEKKFGNNGAKAAASLGISRQRLFSYTSAKALPRPPIFDLILQTWGLNLLGVKPYRRAEAEWESGPRQRLLFESPITLKSDELRVVIKRKGPRVVASIEISADVEIA
jgi:hypothetical protein